MKRLLYLLLGIAILTQGCQTNSVLTDSEKESIVQSVKKASQEFWSTLGQTYDNEIFNKVMKYYDENSDVMWQTDPVAFILNTSINYKQEDWLKQFEAVIGRRISTPCTVSESYYSVLTDKKVVEVINGTASVMYKDSTVVGPFKFVNTSIWGNIDGEWKMQFTHQSTDL
jgi:hypothetical protein